MHQFFFSLLVIFLPTQLGYHFWPMWSMVLGRRVDYLSPTIFVTDILIFCVLFSWIFSKGLHAIKIKPMTVWSFVCVSLIICINIFFSQRPLLAIATWVKAIECVWLGWYIVRTKPSFQRISELFSIGVFYISIIAIGQFMLQHSIGGPLWFLGERTFDVDSPGIAKVIINGKEWLRSYATFPHPNVLGGFLAVVLPFLFYQQTRKPSKFFWSIYILGIVALVSTFSRSSWVILVIGMFWVWHAKKQMFWVPLFLSIVMGIIFFLTPLSSSDESFVVRSELNTAAIQIWKSSPLFGVGAGNFLAALPHHIPSRAIYFLQPVHNIYLLMLSEIGFVGFVGIGIFIYILQRKLLIFKKFSIMHVCLFALLSIGLVDHYPLSLQQGRLLFAVVVGLLCSKVSR
jgi:hypothetical protein